MSNFLDRLKQGAAEAGKKAQVTVEVNRLKLQISSKEKEIQRIYTQIGEAVYRHIQQHEQELPPESFPMIEAIHRLRAEILDIEQKIRGLKSELHCPSCGKANPAGTNFCTGCGTRLGHPAVAPIEVEVLERGEVEAAPTCVSCGKEVMADKSFCHHCGAPVQK